MSLLPAGGSARTSAAKISASVKADTRFANLNGATRRSLISLMLISTSITPTAEANDSKKELLQDYLKRSKDNKAKNDKERLDDYYKKNYKEYFELVEGSIRDKKEGELTEAEKSILEWLQKNRK